MQKGASFSVLLAGKQSTTDRKKTGLYPEAAVSPAHSLRVCFLFLFLFLSRLDCRQETLPDFLQKRHLHPLD